MNTRRASIVASVVALAAIWAGATVHATTEDPEDVDLARSVVGCDTVELTTDAAADMVITLDNADDDWPTTVTGHGTSLVATWPASTHERRWTVTAFIDGEVYSEGGKIEC